MYGFNISVCGTRHRQTQQDCQDYSKILPIRGPAGQKMLAAVACDGVGSAQNSKAGACTAGRVFLKLIQQGLLREKGPLAEKAVLTLLQTAMEGALAAVNALADGEGIPRREYETCLTGCVFTEEGQLWWAHAGDSGIVALNENGLYEKITPRCNGPEAGSVFPLSSRQWRFGRTSQVAGVMICTDGILDHFVADDRLGGLVYWPFLEPAFRTPVNSKKDLAALKKHWQAFMAGTVGYGLPRIVTDDMTVVVLGRDSGCMQAALDKVHWDQEEFSKELKRRRHMVWPELYPEETDRA